MEPEAKKPRLELSTDQLEFLDMNDDCIIRVIENLCTKDMCSMSFVCKRLQELVYATYMRKYPNKSITIRPILGWKTRRIKVGFSDDEEAYLKYMSKAIRNVSMHCTRKSIRDYFQLVKKECCPNLKSLKIYRSKASLSLMPGNMIKDQLKDVETFTIESLPSKRISALHKNWLGNCVKLRQLSIKTQFCNGEWLLDVYPDLESLTIHLLKIDFEKECFGKLAPKFLENHPKLNEIKCVGSETTQLLLQNAKNIPRLIVICKLAFPGNMDRLADKFKVHREKGRIEWLEFDFDHEIEDAYWLKEVDDVYSVNGLRMRLRSPIGQSMIEILKHLLYLELSAKVSGTIDWTRLSKNLLHVETLKLSFEYSFMNFETLPITMPFVRNMPKLKRLDVSADGSAIIRDDHLLDLNSARLLVKNPVHLQVNFELLGNNCKMIIPTSTVLTATVIQNIDKVEDSLGDSSSDDEESSSSFFDTSSDSHSDSDSDSDSDSSSSSGYAPPFFNFLFG